MERCSITTCFLCDIKHTTRDSRILTHPERKRFKLGPMREEIHVDWWTVAVAWFTVTGL